MIQEAAALLLTLATLPGTLELLLVTFGAFLPRSATPSVSKKMHTAVLIPAHNEELDIAAAVDSLKKCKSNADIYVIADNCTDKTSEIAKKSGARLIVRNDPQRLGKHYALNYAIPKILEQPYDLLIFMDADSTASPNLIEEAEREIGSGHAIVQVKYLLKAEEISVKQRLIRIGFNAMNFLRPLGRQGWGLSCGIFGNGFAVRRDILEMMPFSEETLVEDAEYHLRLVGMGFKVAFNENAAVSSDMPSGAKELAEQHASWEGGRIGLLRRQFPILLKGIAKGRLDLVEPLLDLLLMPLSYHTFLLALLLFLKPAWSSAYAMAALTIVAFHLGVSLTISRAPWKDYLSLFAAPLYLMAKLLLIPRVLFQSSKDALWERRSRKSGKRGSH